MAQKQQANQTRSNECAKNKREVVEESVKNLKIQMRAFTRICASMQLSQLREFFQVRTKWGKRVSALGRLTLSARAEWVRGSICRCDPSPGPLALCAQHHSLRWRQVVMTNSVTKKATDRTTDVFSMIKKINSRSLQKRLQ